jgi:hypothetical protein
MKEENTMKLPPQLKNNALNELDFVIKKMKEEPDPSMKLFYYSAVRGIFERTLRLHFEGELLISHTVTDISYQIINDRINHIKVGDNNVPITQNLLDSLIQALVALEEAIKTEQTVYPAIESIMEMAYLATGHGFYTRSFLDYVHTGT